MDTGTALGQEDARDECVHCRLRIYDDGVTLIDATGGDCCDYPIGVGNHGHCRGFAPDSAGDNPDVCIECLCHRLDHADVTLRLALGEAFTVRGERFVIHTGGSDRETARRILADMLLCPLRIVLD